MSAALKVTKTGLFKMKPAEVAVKLRTVYTQSVASAQGRAIATAKSRGRRAVAAASGIKLKSISGRVTGSRSVRRAGKRVPGIILWYYWNFMPMEGFGVPRQGRRGVKSGKLRVDGSFLLQSKKGKRAGKQTVVKRVGEDRLPLRRQGIDARQMDNYSQAFRAAATRGYLQTYDKRLNHEISRRLKRQGLG